MRLLIEYFLKYKDAIVIALAFAGGPLNYVLRDAVALAPNSTPFSFAFMFGGIFLALPFRNLKKLYFKDSPLLFLSLLYLAITAFYMAFYMHNIYMNPKLKIFDSLVIFLTLTFLFYISTISEQELQENLLEAIQMVSFLGCAGLLAYTLINPSYVLGNRLAIAFNDGSEVGAMGNPHIYGRGAFFGILSSLLLLKIDRSKIKTLFSYFSLLIFLVVVILSQAMSSILASSLMVFLFFINNFSLAASSKFFLKLTSKWYFWLVILFVSYKGISFFQEHEDIIETAFSLVERRIDNLISTFTQSEGDRFSKKQVVDASAGGRLALLGLVQEQLNENFDDGLYHKILFGNGYNAIYVDVPIVEVFNSYGLIIFILFSIFFFTTLRYALAVMRKPESMVSEFAAYGFIYFFIFTFTNGLIMDYNRWTFFVFAVRYLPSLRNRILSASQN